LGPTPQHIRTVHFDDIWAYRREELLNVVIMRENPMVRIVKKSRAFHGIYSRAKQGLPGIARPRHDDCVVVHLPVVSEIARLLKEIVINPAGTAIDIQGGEITDTHHTILVSRFSKLRIPSRTSVIAVDGSPSSLLVREAPTASRLSPD